MFLYYYYYYLYSVFQSLLYWIFSKNTTMLHKMPNKWKSFNPYCTGFFQKTQCQLLYLKHLFCFNPYYSGFFQKTSLVIPAKAGIH
jgi:hypothetical protein